MPLSFSEVRTAAEPFRRRLDALKLTLEPPFPGWYPYPTLDVIPVLDSMLKDERRDFAMLAGSTPILDIGCGDGDLSFLLESLGCAVYAIENPDTNFNRTQGFEALRKALNSQVELGIADLDAGLDIEGRTFGLCFCLGLLYHLKNPFALLETVARHARHCILSTRIAQVTPRGKSLEDEPVAYLVDPSETNNDATNYWIFSEPGLRRILDRCGWEILDHTATGVRRGADPARADRDRRMYCMLRSRLPDPWLAADLDGGWHALESGSWRWTARCFAVRLRRPPSPPADLAFRFALPQRVFDALGPVQLRAVVDGSALPARVFGSPGEHEYRERIVHWDPSSGAVRVSFELDKALRPPDDRRELGLQVVFWNYGGEQPQAACPIEFTAEPSAFASGARALTEPRA